MSGETDLGGLLRGLTADLVPGVFVFVTLPDGAVPPGLSIPKACSAVSFLPMASKE